MACRERGTDYRGHMAGAAVRAFLGSQGLGALPRWMEELPRRPRRAVVVPTAGNPLPSTPWVREVAEHLAACQARGLIRTLQTSSETFPEAKWFTLLASCGQSDPGLQARVKLLASAASAASPSSPTQR
jgi:hypothetical protein